MSCCKTPSPITDYERGDIVCSNCGLVLDRLMVVPCYTLGENKASKRKKDKMFTSLGARNAVVDGLGSYVGSRCCRKAIWKDVRGATLSPKNQQKFRRLKVYNYKERIRNKETQYRTLRVFYRACERLGISIPVKERATYLYTKFKKSVTREEIWSSIQLIACCLYLAVKETKYPIHIKQIVKGFKGHKVTASSITSVALTLKPKFKEFFIKLKATPSEKYLPTIMSTVLNDPEVKGFLAKENVVPHDFETAILSTSRALLQRISIVARGGRDPYLFAVAAVYAANQSYAKAQRITPILTQIKISTMTGVLENSLREQWKFLNTYPA